MVREACSGVWVPEWVCAESCAQARAQAHAWQARAWTRVQARAQARAQANDALCFNDLAAHVLQPDFTVIFRPTFSNTHVTWEEPVTSWPQLFLYWDWVVSITIFLFFYLVRGITNGVPEWSSIWWNILQRVGALMARNIFWENGQLLKYIKLVVIFSKTIASIFFFFKMTGWPACKFCELLLVATTTVKLMTPVL